MKRYGKWLGVLALAVVVGGVGLFGFGVRGQLRADDKPAAQAIQSCSGNLTNWFNGWVMARSTGESNFTENIRSLVMNAFMTPAMATCSMSFRNRGQWPPVVPSQISWCGWLNWGCHTVWRSVFASVTAPHGSSTPTSGSNWPSPSR